MKVCAIVPVKGFERAKSRLALPPDAKRTICRIMLDEVLGTLKDSRIIDEILVVSRDSDAGKIAGAHGATCIDDPLESGVNDAVSLCDDHVREYSYNASFVFPQDIPFMQKSDIEFLAKSFAYPACCIIVPSRRFDGTNALFRMPHDIISTRYDEGSYRAHMGEARRATSNTILLFNRGIMADIDVVGDIDHTMGLGIKPDLCRRIRAALSGADAP